MGDKNSFKDLAKSLTETSSSETMLKSDNDDEDVLNERCETGESASSKSYDSNSAKGDEDDDVTNGSSSDRNESNPSASVEYDEKPSVALIRSENDKQTQNAVISKNKKARAKKDNSSSIVPINVDYKNKPKGYSTSTQYVGDDDDYTPGFLPPVPFLPSAKREQNEARIMSVAASIVDDDDDCITENRSTDSTQLQDIKKYKDKIAALEREIASIKSRSESYLDENARIKVQNKVFANDNNVLKEQLEIATTKLSQLELTVKSDSRKVVEERDKLKEKVQVLQKEVAAKQEDYERVSVEKTAFIQRIQTLEKERKSLQKPALTPTETTEDRNRAICAELTVVNLQKNFETDILLRALTDAKKVVSHLDMIIPKCTPEDAVASRKYQDKFKQIVNKFELDIEKMKYEFDNQMDLITKGTRLSTLKRIEPPRPPTPPPMLELKAFPPNQASNRPPPVPPFPSYSARSAGDIFRPPLMTTPNSQQVPLRPQVYPQMNGISSFDMPRGSASQHLSAATNPSAVSNVFAGFSNTAALPRGPSNDMAATVGHMPTRPPLHGVVPPPGLTHNYYDPMKNQASFMPANGPIAPSHESKLFAALNGNVRRNPEPFFNPPSLYHPPVNPEPQQTSSIPSTQSPTGVREKKPVTKLQGIIDLFLERYPAAKDLDIKEAITQYRSSLPTKNLQGVTMSQLKIGLEPILIKKFGPPLSSKSESSTRASSVIDDTAYQQSDRQFHHQPDAEDVECFICYEPKSDGYLQTLECGHEAHKECLDKWIIDNKTCPMCRKWTLADEEFPRL